jgi:hypothetical protein
LCRFTSPRSTPVGSQTVIEPFGVALVEKTERLADDLLR